MKLKLIVALVSDEKTDVVVEAARAGGATGDTI
ncbi:MAG: P-II family nitrogen regulator, partial [Chloroflexi bacterium]|nr:P-II family nitrogen regulator [Chloroflexota bacterium]